MTNRGIRIFTFVESFPHAYKPYYDVQFADLVRAGHDLHIFAAYPGDGPLTEHHKKDGLAGRITYLPPNELRRLPPFLPRVFAGLVHGWSRRAAAIPGAFRTSRRWQRRITEIGRILSLPATPPDAILVHGIGPMELLTWLRALYPGVPVAMYYHGGRPGEAGQTSMQPADIFGATDIVFTNTPYSRSEVIAGGCPPGRIEVLPVGLPVERYRPPEPREYRRGGRLALVTVGRLSEGKGHAHAIDAVAALVADGAPVDYTIVGDGPSREALEAQTAQLGLRDNIRFTGPLPNDAVMRLLGEADALVLSSVSTPTWSETQAVVVQEAILMGAVAITTRTGGVPESIPAFFDAYCVTPGSSVALADALRQLIRLTPAELSVHGERGRAWALANYDIRRLNAALVARLEGTHVTKLLEEAHDAMARLRMKHVDRFAFVHINKTGGSSIEKALRLPFMHLTARELREYLGRDRWGKRYRFAFVRNPWDKVASHYAYRVKTNQTDLGTHTIPFQEWVRRSYGEQEPRYYDKPKMFMPQVDWITDEDGSLMVDFVGRFERLSHDFEAVCGRIGRTATLPHEKQSSNRDFRRGYDAATADIVGAWFARDIAQFGYTFD